MPAWHRKRVQGAVHDPIESDEREAERHELNDWAQPDHCCADSQARKSVLADGSVDDPSWPKALKQTVADLVSALVFRNLFAHQKDIWITLELFRERLVERLTICDFSHGLAPSAYV